MKTTHHLLFYVLLLLVLAQTMAIVFCFFKISIPIDKHLLTKLNKSSGFYKQNLMKANGMAVQFLENKVNKEKRGHEYLSVVKSVKEFAFEQIDSLDFLLKMPSNNTAETAKAMETKMNAFYENLNAIINPNGKTDKVHLDIINAYLKNYKDSLKLPDLQLNDEILKHFIRQKQTDILALSENVIHHFSSKVGDVGILYDKVRVAIIPESTVLEKGDTFKAKVYMAESASMAKPIIQVNGKNLSLDKDGTATYKTTTKTLGKQKLEGFIKLKGAEKNQKDTLAFEIDYEVIEKCK